MNFCDQHSSIMICPPGDHGIAHQRLQPWIPLSKPSINYHSTTSTNAAFMSFADGIHYDGKQGSTFHH